MRAVRRLNQRRNMHQSTVLSAMSKSYVWTAPLVIHGAPADQCTSRQHIFQCTRSKNDADRVVSSDRIYPEGNCDR